MVWMLILILQDPSTGQTETRHIPASHSQARCVQAGKDAEARLQAARPGLKTYSQCVPVLQ